MTNKHVNIVSIIPVETFDMSKFIETFDMSKFAGCSFIDKPKNLDIFECKSYKKFSKFDQLNQSLRDKNNGG